MHVLLIKLIKLLPLTMCCFASVLASSFSYVFTLYLFVCVCSFVFSFYILFCLLNCFIFALVSRPCVLVCPPCLLCVGDICLLCVCVCVISVCALCVYVFRFACVTLYLCVVWASVSCPTGPGCDLSFHLLSLRLLRPTVLRSQPTTQQMSPDTATNTHTQSYVHYVTRTVHVQSFI